MHHRSKTVTAWLAVTLGTLGVHRMYLYGLGDWRAWLHPLPTALGLIGAHRMSSLGQDDTLSWALIPLLGLMISVAMLAAIIYALMPDEAWNQRFNADRVGQATGWGPVLAAALALLVGGTVLMGTIAFGFQKFFEWELQPTATAQSSAKVAP